MVLQHLAGVDAAVYRKLSAESGFVDGTHFRPDSPLIDEPTSVFAARWATLLGRSADPEIALQALLIDPVVNSASAAMKVLDELWDVNRSYIRPCV